MPIPDRAIAIAMEYATTEAIKVTSATWLNWSSFSKTIDSGPKTAARLSNVTNTNSVVDTSLAYPAAHSTSEATRLRIIERSATITSIAR